MNFQNILRVDNFFYLKKKEKKNYFFLFLGFEKNPKEEMGGSMVQEDRLQDHQTLLSEARKLVHTQEAC